MNSNKYEILIKDGEGNEIEVTPFDVFAPDEEESEPVITLMELRNEYEEKHRVLIADFITEKYRKLFASSLNQTDLYDAILVLSNFHREIIKEK
ncbi:hypothetical protein [Fredinandcohnia quinoae]|uniref:Uncharacterized protein n=1 Tax=Fredinandcohnia quinoae TaxID=2918902 RepID=A0AAW5E7Q7_9BACI|nr:hypothetical protein [Fredinandcohnia sp. SECRCQ15]MCH1625645.1 hypothetical protein [Fredinandcohnia sp. SECRCQ15]